MSRAQLLSSSKCFGGEIRKYLHASISTKTNMKFNVFLPSSSSRNRVPVIYFLSGLTCNEDNFMTKAGAQRAAEQHNVAIVCPDTSPRGANIPDEAKDYDFGLAAGFYVNATQVPWAENYRMYDYVVEELDSVVRDTLPVNESKSIMGHSMGGHGALMIYLRNMDKFKSVSAFAPICNPSNCPWGKKAFSGYLGKNQEAWKEYDSTILLQNANKSQFTSEILIDQGGSDEFLSRGQLLPENFVQAANSIDTNLVKYRLHEGYDHSYYFISTFIEDHIKHHASYLH